MQPNKNRSARSDEWKRLRRELLRRIVKNEAKRRAVQAVSTKD